MKNSVKMSLSDITLRTISVILSLATVFVSFTQSVSSGWTAISGGSELSKAEYSEPEDSDDISVLGEDPRERTGSTKSFRMSDGSYKVADYSRTVHFKNGLDVWTDYDNTLLFSDEDHFKGYKNKASDVSYAFSEACENELVRIQSEKYGISFSLSDGSKDSRAELGEPEMDPKESGTDAAFLLPNYSSEVIYRDALCGTDLVYILSGSTLKENIVLKEKAEYTSVSFSINTDGLIAELGEDGAVLFIDKDTADIRFVIPHAYMTDSAGNRSEEVSYSLEEAENGYILSLIPDPGWLDSDERAYPVTVDPTVEKYQTQYTGGLIKDTYIESGNQTPFGSYTFMKAGISGGVECVSLIGIGDSQDPDQPALPVIPKTASIISAELQLMTTDQSAAGVTVGTYQVLDNWNESTAAGTVPSLSPTVLDYFTVTSAGTVCYIDITKPVIAWYNDQTDTLRSRGIALKAVSGSGYASFTTVEDTGHNAQYPVLIISYRDTKGLEDQWQFFTYGAGNAGTGHVGLFNGNLVFETEDISSSGNLLPVSVSHVFNSSMAGEEFTSGNSALTSDFTNMKVGKGWKLNIQKTVVPVILGNESWLVWNDPDGTELYFYPDTGNNYISEDGYPLSMTVNSSGTYRYEIASDSGHTEYYDWDGRLVRETDAFGNARDYLYANGQLISVSLTPSGGTGSVQLEFQYNTAGALKKITTPLDSSETVEFYYSADYNGTFSNSSAGYLRKIDSSKSGICTFEYNADGTLWKTTDSDTSYKTVCAYGCLNGFSRISSISEYSGSSPGQTVGFFYDGRTASVRSSGLNDIYNDQDDILTNYLFDTYGKAVCVYSSSTDKDEIYGSSYSEYTDFVSGSRQNNKLKVDAVKGKSADNLLLNHNCESFSGWSGYYHGSSRYTSSVTTSEHLYGESSFKLYSTTTATGYIRRVQTVTVPETGDYTLSAYVKTENVSAGTNSGAYIILDGLESKRVKGTTNQDIGNGWRRISVTKTLTANTAVSAEMRLANASGNAFFDCLQLEKGDVPSDYDFIQNGGMTLSSGWSAPAVYSSTEGKYLMSLTGTPAGTNTVYQTVSVNIPEDTTLMLSGWGKADSVPTGTDDRSFRIRAVLHYTDDTTEEFVSDLNPYLGGWQFTSAVIVPEDDVSTVTVYLDYDYNCNTAFFDGITLTAEPAKTYDYDLYGNLTALTNENGNKSLLEYASNGIDIAGFTDQYGSNYDFTYKSVGSVSTHEVETVTEKDSDDNTVQELQYQYDAYGNPVSSVLESPNETGTVSTSVSYIDSGSFISSVTDSLGGITSFGYDSAKLLKYVENACSFRTGYLYDSRDRVSSVFLDLDRDGTADSHEPYVNYTYTNGRLTGISTDTVAYTVSYDGFGNIVQIKAGSNTLASYTYAPGNGKLQSMTFGNGDQEEYFYDRLDRLVSVKFNDTVTYTLVYGANGSPAECTDHRSGITYSYEYDGIGRLVRAWQNDTSTGSEILGIENQYDDHGRKEQISYAAGDRTLVYGASYVPEKDLISSLSLPEAGTSVGYTYDSFERLKSKSITLPAHSISEEYGYCTYTSGTDQHTTPLISSVTFKRDSYANSSLTYTYDQLGNILTVSENGIQKISYQYDGLNQLVRENNAYADKTWTYSYDLAGNITLKKEYSYTTGTLPSSYYLIPYSYSGAGWNDLLTYYNGTSIGYDGIGNPTSWKGLDSLQWDGRQLKKITVDNYGSELEFTYDSDGIRTSKTLTDENGYRTEHTYLLDGTKIIRETVTDDLSESSYILYYLYDAFDNITGFEYSGTPYYYLKDLQGDIVRICDASGMTVVSYTYDAWGNVLSTSGSLASTIGQINPFRYRGYYYDTETGLYYLQSRYYDPVVGRFLNGDGIIGANGGLRGYNSFAYCSNNPVIYYDPDGESATVLICGIAVSVESIIVWGVGLTVVAISIAYITDPAFRARCDKAISSIIDSFIKGLKSLHCLSTAVINNVGGQIKTIEKKITASFARATKIDIRSPQRHHIVAKGATNAKYAKDILNSVLEGGVENDDNIIMLKAGLHSRIHAPGVRDIYYGMTNSMVISAYRSNGKNGVIAVLGQLKKLLRKWNESALF